MTVERHSVPTVAVDMASVLTLNAGVTLGGNMLTVVCANVSTIANRGATVKMVLVCVHLAMVAMTVERKYV